MTLPMYAATMTPEIAAVSGIVLGLCWHGVYNRYEPNIRSFARDLGLTVVGFTLICALGSQPPETTVKLAILFSFIELAVLALSIALYRLFFHPLRKFPGPTLAKLTKWTGAYWVSTGKLHNILSALHEEYGDIVRVGPNELSFGSVDAIKHVHGTGAAKLTKGPYAEGTVYGSPGVAMPNTRDFHDHKLRRRMWDHGFTKSQLTAYEPRVLALIDTLCERLRELDGQVVDMGRWLDYVTFDVMGDLGFSKSFGLLNDDGPRFYSEAVRSGIRLRSIIGNVPWMSPIAYLLPMDPTFKKLTGRFRALSKSIFQERRAKGTEPDDIFTYVLGEGKDGVKPKEGDLQADAPILIIGGSDTTSITSRLLYYFITRDKPLYSRLRDEIDKAWDGKSDLNSEALLPEKCPLLNGAIYESLRIWPPGPNHQQRRTLENAPHLVDNVLIPPRTQIAVHVLTVQRSPKYFTNPLDFVPERWTASLREPSWNHDSKAWIPFQTGAYACAGKQLALVELRVLIAKLIRNFDIIMPDSFDHAAFQESIKSFQSIVMGPLPLQVKSRMGN